MKGIILAGGTGSRLLPVTRSVSKQLLPVYDKPMIYYPLSTLMLAGIREILIITTSRDQAQFKNLLGVGEDFGVKLIYAVQDFPRGIAEAFIIGKKFLSGDNCMLILGDNVFHGNGVGASLSKKNFYTGSHVFTYEVANPSDYGILELDPQGRPISIEEKPREPKSRLAVTGLYNFDSRVSEVAEAVMPSSRGELEITSIIDFYIKNNELSYTTLSRGTAWLDTGNPNSLHDASSYVRVIEERTGLKVGCPEEIAFKNNWISSDKLNSIITELGSNNYSHYLQRLLTD